MDDTFQSGTNTLACHIKRPVIRVAEPNPPGMILCHGFPIGPIDARRSAGTFPELVDRIAYDAKGQRALVAYGNGVMTRHAYDPDTFRLRRPRSERYTTDGVSYRPSGAALQDEAEVAKGLAGTRAFVSELFASVQAGAKAGKDLKAVYRETYDRLKPGYGQWVIFDHCLPFDVTRAYDEATQYADPRIWTAERDQQMWQSLEG